MLMFSKKANRKIKFSLHLGMSTWSRSYKIKTSTWRKVQLNFYLYVIIQVLTRAFVPFISHLKIFFMSKITPDLKWDPWNRKNIVEDLFALIFWWRQIHKYYEELLQFPESSVCFLKSQKTTTSDIIITTIESVQRKNFKSEEAQNENFQNI